MRYKRQGWSLGISWMTYLRLVGWLVGLVESSWMNMGQGWVEEVSLDR